MNVIVITALALAIAMPAAQAQEAAAGSAAETLPRYLVSSADLTHEDYKTICRCASAAHWAVQTLKVDIPTAEERSAWFINVVDDERFKAKFGEYMPTVENLVVAQASVEAMVQANAAPKDDLDEQMLNALGAATCALHAARRRKP